MKLLIHKYIQNKVAISSANYATHSKNQKRTRKIRKQMQFLTQSQNVIGGKIDRTK